MFDAHVLAEVRPLVRSMPEQQYVAQTNGSARMRVSKFEDGRYRVRGIPGHTHNSTAICSVEADFTKMRLVDLAVAPTFRYTDEEKYNAGDFTESEHFVAADEVEIYDRAIEKGIGNIRLVPENCHQEIDEPTRAIAEIRTIVSSKQQLDSLTYIDEMGSHVDAITGYDATDVFDGQVPVYILGLRGAMPDVPPNRYAESRIIFTDTNNILRGVFAISDDNGTYADTGALWDGTRIFEWDQNDQQYVAQALSVNLKVRPIAFVAQTAAPGAQLQFAVANSGAQDTAGAEQLVRVDFEAFTTSTAVDRNCIIQHGTNSNSETLSAPVAYNNTAAPAYFFQTTQAAGELIEPLFGCKVTLADGTTPTVLNGQVVTSSYLHGMPVARIPVGRPHVIYGPKRQYKTGLLAPNALRSYGSGHHADSTVSVSDRIRRVDPNTKVNLYYAALDAAYTYAFPGAGALTCTLTAGAANHALNAGIMFNGTDLCHHAHGFNYTVAEANGVASAGPFSVAMQTSFLCNDLTDDASYGGGSIFGRMQAALGSNNGALALVGAVAPGDTHNPNSVALQAHDRFTTTAAVANAASANVYLDSGATLHDIFRAAQDDLQPFEVISFNNETADYNISALSTPFRNFVRDNRDTPGTLVVSQEIDDVLSAARYYDDAGAAQDYYDQYVPSMRNTIKQFTNARQSALRRHAESRPACCTMPMKIDFVHDRLRVTTPVFADGYTYNAADAALGNGGGGFADSSEVCQHRQT